MCLMRVALVMAWVATRDCMQDVHFACECCNLSADLPEADACALHSGIRLNYLLECPVACWELYPGPTTHV